MAFESYSSKRVKNGWVAVARAPTGEWLLSWEPDEGHPDYPGRTLSPKDDEYPDGVDPDELLRWGVERWGDA